MEATFDVFLGHASVDKDKGVREFAVQLVRLGLRVFVDERVIDSYGPITRTIEEALAGSLAFVAWFSAVYPGRRACQLELRAAYVAAEGAREVSERIFAVNPEDGFAHIQPATLRDARIPTEGVAEAILARVEALHERGAGPLGSLARLRAPVPVPQRTLGSPRFVGRVPELWLLHGHLQAGRIEQVSRTSREEVALIGFGGVGKSLLAEEYAQSFGPAYPGGIYWLSAAGAAPGDESVILDQLTIIAGPLGVSLDGNHEPIGDPIVLRHRLAGALAERERALWIVDALPEGLTAAEAQAWAAPHEQAATLITTRSSDYTAFAGVQLDVLDEPSALELLTSDHEPAGDEESEAARVIAVDRLGGHAQALDVARSLIGGRPGKSAYRDVLQRIDDSSVVLRLEHAALITRQLPNGHEASIVATLSAAIEGLDADARDLLRVASQLAVAPIELEFAAASTPQDAESEGAAADRVDRALSQLRGSSLAQPTQTSAGKSAYLVHTIVAAVAQHIDTPHPGRAEALRARAIGILVARLRASGNLLHDEASATELQSGVTHARHLTTNVDSTDDTSLHTLALWVAALDFARGAYGPARHLGEAVLEARKRLLGPEHPDTLGETV